MIPREHCMVGLSGILSNNYIDNPECWEPKIHSLGETLLPTKVYTRFTCQWDTYDNLLVWNELMAQ